MIQRPCLSEAPEPEDFPEEEEGRIEKSQGSNKDSR